jgi:hypothetical protein
MSWAFMEMQKWRAYLVVMSSILGMMMPYIEKLLPNFRSLEMQMGYFQL